MENQNCPECGQKMKSSARRGGVDRKQPMMKCDNGHEFTVRGLNFEKAEREASN